MPRLVVVSNRVSTSTTIASAGGLAVALGSALREKQGLWIGWSGKFTRKAEPRPNQSEADGIAYATFDLDREDYDAYYNGFANRTLWPLFHYRTDLTSFNRRFYEGYQKVNRFFAKAIAPLLRPDDLVWVHDYHLIPLAEELRRFGCKQPIGYFLHIPFPATEVLLSLPNHRSLVRALFAYDLVGFQTASDLRSFADYAVYEAGGSVTGQGTLAAFQRELRAAVFSIGIDTEEFVRMAETPEAKRSNSRIRNSLGGRKLIIGVDRLDYTKGLVERFQSVERLFEDYQEHRGQVAMLQIAPPSRAEVPEYIALREELEAVTGAINGRYAEFDWVPIRYTNRAYTRRSLAGLYRASHVGLVTPFRDGMNLVAKEFVVAQDPDDPGVLILSRFAGAADGMPEALIVNPYDIDEVSEALNRSLLMPLGERRERHMVLLARLRTNTVFTWRDRFVTALTRVAQASTKNNDADVERPHRRKPRAGASRDFPAG